MALPSKTQEIDSGCPGSDRSTLWLSYLQSKRASPSTRSNSKSKENISTSLYNLEEETFPPSPRPRLAGDQAPVTPRDIVQLNTDFVASITIEQLAATSTPLQPGDRGHQSSSDEQQPPRPVPPTPARTAARLTACKTLFPGVENSELAQQIDNEILELRNFFDDHREEMLHLLHGGKEAADTSLPVLPPPAHAQWGGAQTQSLGNLRHQSAAATSTDRSATPELPDPALFPGAECGAGAGAGRGGMFSSLQDWATWREESESEQQQDNTLRIRKLEFEKRRRKKERQRRRLVTGEGEEVGQPLKQNIQSFFPTFQEFHDPSRHNPGLAGEDEDNEIPLLNLSDLTSEVTAADMSVISEAFSAVNGLGLEQEADSGCSARPGPGPRGEVARSVGCDTLDLGCAKTTSSSAATPTRARHPAASLGPHTAFNLSLGSVAALEGPPHSQLIICTAAPPPHQGTRTSGKQGRKKRKQKSQVKVKIS